MIVLAPGRFSTMTRWPSCSPSLSPMMRESVSLPPPAAYGDTMRMGRVGYCWAKSEPAKNVVTNRTVNLRAAIDECSAINRLYQSAQISDCERLVRDLRAGEDR